MNLIESRRLDRQFFARSPGGTSGDDAANVWPGLSHTHEDHPCFVAAIDGALLDVKEIYCEINNYSHAF